MVNEVIPSWLEIRRRRKVDSKVFASLLDFIVTPRQSNDIRVEFYPPESVLATGGRYKITSEIYFERLWIITSGIAGDEEGLNVNWTTTLPIYRIQNSRHLIQFLRTNIGASCKSKVNLPSNAMRITVRYQGMFPRIRILRYFVSEMFYQIVRATNSRCSHSFVLRRDAFSQPVKFTGSLRSLLTRSFSYRK